MMAQNPSPRRDINAVLAAHGKELLKIPGVVGVYVGLLPDGKSNCLKVMLSQHSTEAEKRIPREIEGYRTIVEVTGEIRPLER